MSISSTDLVYYGAQNNVDSDGTTQGGSILVTTQIIFTDISATDEVEILSSSGSDTTQTVTIYGRNAAGELVNEAEVLNGSSVQTTTTQFERILKITLSGAAVGTVTVRKESDNVTVASILPGTTLVKRLFYNTSSDASGGSSRDYYEKIFVKNTHATLSLTTATIAEISDSTGKITFDLESSKGGSNSIASRLNTPPSSMLGSFDNTTKSIPTGNLAAGENQGIWAKLTVAAADAATKSTWGVRTSGLST